MAATQIAAKLASQSAGKLARRTTKRRIQISIGAGANLRNAADAPEIARRRRRRRRPLGERARYQRRNWKPQAAQLKVKLGRAPRKWRTRLASDGLSLARLSKLAFWKAVAVERASVHACMHASFYFGANNQMRALTQLGEIAFDRSARLQSVCLIVGWRCCCFSRKCDYGAPADTMRAWRGQLICETTISGDLRR